MGAEDEPVIVPQIPELEPFGVLCRLVGFERLYSPPREPYAASLAVLGRGEGRTSFSP